MSSSPRQLVSRGRGIVLAVIASLLWSTGGLLVKLPEWSPLAISGGRSFVSLLILLPVARVTVRRITGLTVLSGLFYAATLTTYVLANRMTTAANTILLQYTAPIYVALLSWWLLGERVRRRDWGAVVLVLFGVAMLLSGDLGSGSSLGNLLALTSGVSFSLLLITLRMQKHAYPLDAIVIGNLIGALVAIPAYAPFPSDPVSWTAVIALGVVQVALPYIIYSHAIRVITAVEAVLIKGIEPVLNPLWVFLVIGEQPTRLALLGGAVVLVTITMRNALASRPNAPRHPPPAP
ncbi:MAG: DMT family transporter [Alkalispirochaetaceae bacterium]